MALTYHSYLRIEELLSLQQLQSPDEHDETLFIIIHQAYELWFKQMLHELDYAKSLLEANEPRLAAPKMKRVLTILKVLVHQVDILETMNPIEFLSFRDYLETASGFQSYQWRELEYSLGLKNPHHMGRFEEGSAIRQQLEKRFREPSLWQCFIDFLARRGYGVSAEKESSGNDGLDNSSEGIRKVLVEIYYHEPELRAFCELLVDLDEGIQEWRYRHVKMVERTIGSKPGTGGSPGVEYLKKSLFQPLFPDLWAIRSSFAPQID